MKMKTQQGKLVGLALGLLVFVGVLGTSIAKADTLDPANLHIGPGLGTSCQAGCAGDPNEVGLNKLDIWDVGSGGPYANPLLLIIGIRNDSSGGTGAPTTIGVSTNLSSTAVGQLGGTDAYGGDWAQSGANAGYAGLWSNSSGNDVYTFVKLDLGTSGNSQADKSNNWTNWSGAPGDAGVTGFGIYVYELNNTGLSGGNGVNITFGSNLPTGTLAIAFACTDSSCSNNPNPYDTAFTEAGDVTVPEPALRVMLGMSLICAFGLLRRKLNLV
ncbi:MAG: hypothetical protein ACYDA9_02980 [Terriglobia bacterium]